jgi:NADPH-dependent ferric siderophore reductase
MAADRLLDMVGRPGGPLADASLWDLEVIEVSALSPGFRRMVVTAPGLEGLRCTAGQDLMFRVPRGDGAVTNRRYTIRRFDASRAQAVVDVSLHGAGPGTDWVRQARVGDRIDAIGPRGKITPVPEADWHVFVADDTGVPGALAMIEALPPTSTISAVFEVDTPEDEQDPDVPPRPQLAVRWLHRDGRSAPGDAAPLHDALAALDLPAGDGHAYIAAETAVVRDLQELATQRGLRSEQISAKAYWRRGLPNADHGEPARPD